MKKSWLESQGVSVDRLLSLSLIDQAGSIQSASVQSGKSPSLLSRQVSELEGIEGRYKGKGLNGITLLNRETLPHTLTAQGEYLARLTQEFVQEFDRYVSAQKKKDEIITVAAGESIILWLLIPLLSQQTQKIRFRNMRSHQAFEAMKKGMVDIAIHHEKDGELDTQDSARWQTSPVGNYELQVIGNRSLFEGKTIQTWEDVEALAVSVVTLEGGGSTRRLVEKLCAQYPQGPQIALECTSHPQIVEACRNEAYIGIVPQIADPKFYAKKESEDFCFFSIEELQEQRIKLGCSTLTRRHENSALIRAVYQALIG